MRSYLVIPAGAPVLRVNASTPHFAASKAKRGKAEHFETDVFVVPVSAAINPHNGRPIVHPHQLSLVAEGPG